jgi:hypothetical protein
MELPSEVRADLTVAVAVAACTVALSFVLRYGLGMGATIWVRTSPLAVYFGYLFFGKGTTGSVVERPLVWAITAVVVTVVAGVYAVVSPV